MENLAFYVVGRQLYYGTILAEEAGVHGVRKKPGQMRLIRMGPGFYAYLPFFSWPMIRCMLLSDRQYREDSSSNIYQRGRDKTN